MRLEMDCNQPPIVEAKLNRNGTTVTVVVGEDGIGPGQYNVALTDSDSVKPPSFSELIANISNGAARVELIDECNVRSPGLEPGAVLEMPRPLLIVGFDKVDLSQRFVVDLDVATVAFTCTYVGEPRSFEHIQHVVRKTYLDVTTGYMEPESMRLSRWQPSEWLLERQRHVLHLVLPMPEIQLFYFWANLRPDANTPSFYTREKALSAAKIQKEHADAIQNCLTRFAEESGSGRDCWNFTHHAMYNTTDEFGTFCAGCCASATAPGITVISTKDPETAFVKTHACAYKQVLYANDTYDAAIVHDAVECVRITV